MHLPPADSRVGQFCSVWEFSCLGLLTIVYGHLSAMYLPALRSIQFFIKMDIFRKLRYFRTMHISKPDSRVGKFFHGQALFMFIRVLCLAVVYLGGSILKKYIFLRVYVLFCYLMNFSVQFIRMVHIDLKKYSFVYIQSKSP